MMTNVLVATVTVAGEPVSKERARVVRGGTFTPPKTLAAEEAIAWMFRQAARAWKVDRNSQFVVEMGFHCKTRHRRDIDNMIKLVLDALNKLCWWDDSQVTEVRAIKYQESTEPLTTVTIYRLESE